MCPLCYLHGKKLLGLRRVICKVANDIWLDAVPQHGHLLVCEMTIWQNGKNLVYCTLCLPEIPPLGIV